MRKYDQLKKNIGLIPAGEYKKISVIRCDIDC